MLTWSFGWTGFFEPSSPPRISIARFEMTCAEACQRRCSCRRTAGTDLVDVHVGLGAGTGLEDDEGKVLHANLAGDDLIGGLLDGVADLLVEAVGHVDLGGGALEDGKGLDEGERHALGLAANVKVLDRAVYKCLEVSTHLECTPSEVRGTREVVAPQRSRSHASE